MKFILATLAVVYAQEEEETAGEEVVCATSADCAETECCAMYEDGSLACATDDGETMCVDGEEEASSSLFASVATLAVAATMMY